MIVINQMYEEKEDINQDENIEILLLLEDGRISGKYGSYKLVTLNTWKKIKRVLLLDFIDVSEIKLITDTSKLNAFKLLFGTEHDCCGVGEFDNIINTLLNIYDLFKEFKSRYDVSLINKDFNDDFEHVSFYNSIPLEYKNGIVMNLNKLEYTNHPVEYAAFAEVSHLYDDKFVNIKFE